MELISLMGTLFLFNLFFLSVYLDFNLAAHPWVREGGDASEIPVDISVLSNMREFVMYSRMKQFALRVFLFYGITYLLFLNHYLGSKTSRDISGISKYT